MLSKRITTIIIMIGLLLTLTSVQAFCTEVSPVTLDAALKDPAGWNAKEEEVVFKDSSLVHTVPENAYTVFGYMKETYLNEEIEFDACFKFDGVEPWQGIMIRSTSPTAMPWETKINSNYLVVVKEDQIELQRFSSKSAYLAVVPTPFQEGERVNIRFAAVNVDEGVQLTFKVNGKTLINEIDTHETAIKEAGYVGFFNASTLKLLPSSRKKQKDAPSVALTQIQGEGFIGNTLTADYVYNDLGGGREGNSIYRWYRTLAPIDVFGFGRKMLYPENFKEDYLEQIKGANGKSYEITEDDSNYYLLFSVQPKSAETGMVGEEVFSNQIYVSYMENLLSDGIYFVADCPYALVYGERMMIRPGNKKFAPFDENKELYIPLRFTAEALGYQVDWDAKTNTTSIRLTDGKTKVVDNKTLPNRYDSVLIPMGEAAELFGIPTSYQPMYGLGMMSDLGEGKDPIDYRVLFRTIRDEVEQ